MKYLVLIMAATLYGSLGAALNRYGLMKSPIAWALYGYGFAVVTSLLTKFVDNINTELEEPTPVASDPITPSFPGWDLSKIKNIEDPEIKVEASTDPVDIIDFDGIDFENMFKNCKTNPLHLPEDYELNPDSFKGMFEPKETEIKVGDKITLRSHKAFGFQHHTSVPVVNVYGDDIVIKDKVEHIHLKRSQITKTEKGGLIVEQIVSWEQV